MRALLLDDAPTAPTLTHDIIFGALCGGLLLARTDMIFVVLALLALRCVPLP